MIHSYTCFITYFVGSGKLAHIRRGRAWAGLGRACFITYFVYLSRHSGKPAHIRRGRAWPFIYLFYHLVNLGGNLLFSLPTLGNFPHLGSIRLHTLPIPFKYLVLSLNQGLILFFLGKFFENVRHPTLITSQKIVT